MRRSLVLSSLLALLVVLSFSGCGKKKAPVVRPPAQPTQPAPAPARPAPAAPTISLSASPTTIDRGGQTTLTWNSSHASSIVIDGGVGNVSPTGSIVVSPRDSTTYTAVASGRGGESRASTRVTVLEPKKVLPDRAVTDRQGLRDAIDKGDVQPVFFAYDKAELSENAIETLKQNARVFRSFPRARVIIEGHCDERGTEEYNLALGDRRALAARDYLVQLGVDASQLETISYGEERPFAKGSNERAWSLNRRAHFVVK